MKTVIFCGGKGTRLREETEFRPKPMVPIGGEPILWHIMKIYAAHGFKDFILCLGYKGEMIKDYFLNYHRNCGDITLQLGGAPLPVYHDRHDEEDWTVTLAETGEETSTSTRLRRIERHLGADREFLLTYGDGVGNIPIPQVIEAHRRAGKLITVTAVHPPGRFGDLDLKPDGSVLGFDEKPQTEGGWINGGFFVVSREIFKHLGKYADVMFERGPLQDLAKAGKLHAYRHEGFWQPMDTMVEFQYLNKVWAEGKAPWKVW